MSAEPHILVVGFGSAGRRHAQNLSRRGAAISIVEPRRDRLQSEDVTIRGAYDSVADALAHGSFAGAVVATPTAFHVDQARQLLEAGCRVLLEKPVAIDLAAAKTLAEAEARSGLPILLGYTWRWWPALREFRYRLQKGVIGRPLRAEFIMASHLQDWHPGEPLSEFFMSSAKLGGGALLDESHWLDQMLWMFGPPQEIAAEVGKISELPIDSDDHVELQAAYTDGLRARIHLDLYTRPTERTIAVYGDAGALKWTFERNVLSQFRGDDAVWRDSVFKNERNDMFDAVAAEFLDVLAEKARPSCTLADGLRVMTVVDLARASSLARGERMKFATRLAHGLE